MEQGTDPATRLARVPSAVPRVDVAIAAGLLVWALLEATLVSGPGDVETRIAFAFAISVPLVARRRFPVEVLVFVVIATIARNLSLDGPDEGAMPFPSLLLGTFSAALYARPQVLAYFAIPLPIIGIAFGLETAGGQSPADYAILSFIAFGAWIGGYLVRRRAMQLEHAVAASGELARSAVADERARIARELHDVVAHSVSIVAVQAGAAEEQLDRDPERAREHLAAVRRTAREAMTEMRRLLDVLRTDDASYAPQPGLSALDDLIADARDAGMEVGLERTGEDRVLPAGVDLVAYRIVQEALTNARKHSSGAEAQVTITYGGKRVGIEVVNGPGAPGPSAPNGAGHGLVGMRERVRLYGGTVNAGPEPDGGFAVRATIPVDGEAP